MERWDLLSLELLIKHVVNEDIVVNHVDNFKDNILEYKYMKIIQCELRINLAVCFQLKRLKKQPE